MNAYLLSCHNDERCVTGGKMHVCVTCWSGRHVCEKGGGERDNKQEREREREEEEGGRRNIVS